jgi:hypothetical protein
LVSTIAPPALAALSAVPDAAGLDAGAELDAGALEAPEPPEAVELPHAAAINATAASSSGTSHLLLIMLFLILYLRQQNLGQILRST